LASRRVAVNELITSLIIAYKYHEMPFKHI
jgi:hypothetical protein